MMTALHARAEAARWLDVPEFRSRRWRHVQEVAAKAELLAPVFGDLLVSAAWLHDIGYAPGLRDSGFHPLDGARHLLGLDPRVASLVAHHSGAVHEARLRRLDGDLAAFPDERSPVRDALWTCDMTTGPAGEPMTFEERLAEIVERYGPGHTVTRAMASAAGEIRAAIERTRWHAFEHGYAV